MQDFYFLVEICIEIGFIVFNFLDSFGTVFLFLFFFTLFPCDSVRCLQNMLFLLKRHLVLQEQNLKITLEDEGSSQLL